MLKYRIISFVLGICVFLVALFSLTSMNDHRIGPLVALASILAGLVTASKSYTTFQSFEAKKNGNPLGDVDLDKIKKTRFVLIVIWAAAAFILSIQDFGNYSYRLRFPIILSVVIFSILHFSLTNSRYKEALDKAKRNAEHGRKQRAINEEIALNRKKTEEVWSVLTHKINERHEDRCIKDMVVFFDRMKWLKEHIRNEPMTAAEYPYAIEYLPYAYRYENFMKSLKERCLNSSVETLMAEYDEFVTDNIPLSEGYYEKKATHENSLKSKTKITGVNDI